MTEDVATRITLATAPWGSLAVTPSVGDDLLGIVGVSERDGPTYKLGSRALQGHPLESVDSRTGNGAWYRVDQGLHELHRWLYRVRASMPASELIGHIDAWRHIGGEYATVVITYSPSAERQWAAWAVTGKVAMPVTLTILQDPDTDPLMEVRDSWPLEQIRSAHVVVVGVGSIGSAIATCLARYGVGRLTLVDDDRLLWHNLVRHQCDRRSVGRFKVNAMAEQLTRRWPGTDVEPLRCNVITDADTMRPLFKTASVVVCAADGVAPRRVVSHLAKRAGVPSVLACVLLDGAIGEVLRLRPWRSHACLLCQRAHLVAAGVLDPEPGLDRPYGTGDPHLPMTAIGSDLVTVADLASKVTVATHLQSYGHHDQVVRGEYAMIGLRPTGDCLEIGPPFDVGCGETRWSPAVAPRAGCPTCRT